MALGAKRLGRPATRADLERLPENVVGEIIDGVLYTHARPRPRHGAAAGEVFNELRDPFQWGRGGPGGWWILIEPGIELPGAPEIAPNLAGWRHARLAELPEDGPIRVVPDWVCEVLSPTTRTYDASVKRPYYARVGVPWLWFIDVEAKTLTVDELVDGRWVEVGVWAENVVVRAPPFDAIKLHLSDWWRYQAPKPAKRKRTKGTR